MLAQDAVARLEVAVDHAARVGVIDRVADIEEAAEQLAQFVIRRSALCPTECVRAGFPINNDFVAQHGKFPRKSVRTPPRRASCYLACRVAPAGSSSLQPATAVTR